MSESSSRHSFQQQMAQAIGEAIRELNRDGWEVVELQTNRVDWLPERLRHFEPDFVARRGKEVIIGAFKSRNSESLDDLDGLAKAVAEVPDARLEVYWLGDNAQGELVRDHVQEYANEAKALLSMGRLRPAALVAWAAVEGALVYHATNLEVPLPDDGHYTTLPWRLLSYLDSLGYINEADLKWLTELRNERNAAAHFRGPDDPPSRAAIEHCLEVVNRMLSGRYVSVDQMMEWFVEHHDYPDVPVQKPDRNRIQALLVEQFPGARESDIEEVVAGIVHDAAI